MPSRLEGIKQFSCTYSDCAHSFPTLQEMKSHKIDNPEHDYCKKCDVDCDGWVDFTQHKVDAMAPWLESRVPPSGNPKHITCEFCGMDFKSFGGRNAHRFQAHKAEQSVTCPCCGAIFVKASLMIGHIERGRCPKVTAREFRACVQHKYVVKEIMKNPHEITKNLELHPSLQPPKMPGLIKDGEGEAQSVDDDGGQDQGGVPILDTVDPAQKGGQLPIQAEDTVEVHGTRVPLTRQNLERWPRLPGMDKAQVADYLKTLNINDSSASTASVTAQMSMSDVTSRRGGVKVYTESHASQQEASSTGETEVDDNGSDHDSVSTARPEDVLNREPDFRLLSKRQKYNKTSTNAWSSGAPSSRALFPAAKAAPPSTQLKSILKQRDAAEPSQNLNLFEFRFWDPNDEQYDAMRFYEPAIEAYTCPFPGCDMTPVESVGQLEEHFTEFHARTHFRCDAPSCLKRFKTCEALISHYESGTTCLVQKHKNFKIMLEEVTGGFLKAKRLPEPAIYRPENAVAKAGQPIGGVMPILYKGKLPHQR